MANGLTLPRVAINGIIINIVPNSLKYIEGKGTISVKAASGGGGVVVPIFMPDKTEAIGAVMFKIYPTNESITQIQDFRELGNDNTLSITDNGFNKSSTGMVVGTEDIEYALGVDEQIEVTCKGANVV